MGKQNNLRVISTPTFPVPYYQRIYRNPPSPEEVTIDLLNQMETIDDGTVIRLRHDLAKTSEGQKIVEFMDKYYESHTLETQIDSPSIQCSIYQEDLTHYLDCAHEENIRILKECDLADIFK